MGVTGMAGVAVSGQAVAARRRPNILLILADDMGYSDLGCYGGEIDTANLDRLAANGVRFTRFYNAARCCPTRASLLTGLYPHQAGMGRMVSRKPKPEGQGGPNQGYLNEHCVTIAEVLRDAGYGTYMAGKWHVGEFRPAWPVDRGFDRHFGLISGAMNYWNIELGKSPETVRHFARDGESYRPPPGRFYSTDAFTDNALEMLRGHDRRKPFFLYLAYNAPHWPLHAPEDLIRKYEGRYREGWSALRRARHRRMLELGVIGERFALSPQDPAAAQWDALDEEQKRIMDRKMAVYAAMIDRMDQNIGRVLDFLRESGQLDHTLVMFLSDNGACHEGGNLGHDFRPDLTGPIGSERSYHSYGLSWSNASNTPFRLHKHWTHEGGVATPLIAHWPAGFQARNAFRHPVGHVMDLMATCAEVAHAQYPARFRGHDITSMEGISLVPFLDSDLPVDRTLFWEHFGNRAVRDGKWKLVATGEKGPWELYDMDRDPCELRNLATEQPERVTALKASWIAWAQRVGAPTPGG
ncbi:MAG: arylsulfatase [Lentisphaeria bacterium]|nr:arylsulfatase [Lentisphaeria bacterium]